MNARRTLEDLMGFTILRTLLLYPAFLTVLGIPMCTPPAKPPFTEPDLERLFGDRANAISSTSQLVHDYVQSSDKQVDLQKIEAEYNSIRDLYDSAIDTLSLTVVAGANAVQHYPFLNSLIPDIHSKVDALTKHSEANGGSSRTLPYVDTISIWDWMDATPIPHVRRVWRHPNMATSNDRDSARRELIKSKMPSFREIVQQFS
jgi:hypothetical protein